MAKYQVLARKYRPQLFKEVVGQETIVTTLKNALRLKKIAHAYLFCGGRGTGKTTLARLFAKALNCESLGNDQEPCNQCSSCLEIMGGQSLDVIEIDGASNRGIDDIRQINEMVGYVPSHGRYKIYIIDEVHMLTKEAFNALLKTLEEPPPQAKFFFATTEPHKILPTIISRCQRFDLGRISPTQIIAKLEQIARDLSRDVDIEALHKIGDLSDGSLRDAESLFDQLLCYVEEKITADTVAQVFGLVSQEHFFALDTAFSEGRLPFAFELVSHLFDSGKDLAHFMSQLIDHYRLIAIAKTLGEQALPSPISASYMQSSRHYTQQQSLYLLEYLMTAEAGMQKSLSPRIFLENALLHIIRAKNRIPIEVLVRRLSELEGALSTQGPSPSIRQEAVSFASAPKILSEKTIFPAKEEAPSAPEKELIPKIEPASPPLEKAPTPKKELALPPLEQAPTPKKELALPPLEQAPTLQNEKAPTPKKEPPISSSEKMAEPQKDIPVSHTPKPLPSAKEPSKHPSYYDTLIRFAAVELEGSIKI